MAPWVPTEDYYMILEVEQTAAPELIIQSYKRLALKLHPDRNAKNDTTAQFQLLGQAYETLKDSIKRHDYDQRYPSIRKEQTPRPHTASNPQSDSPTETAQIATLQKLKQERSARWSSEKKTFESSIFELQREIRRVERDIRDLDSITAAEAAKEAQKNSWSAWFLSGLYKKEEVSEEQKLRDDRRRQERRIEKDMKERRLSLKKADIKQKEGLFRKAKEVVDAADNVDNQKIQRLQSVIMRDRQERERVAKSRAEQQERERVAKLRKEWQEQQKQQEKRNQEAAEMLRKHQAEVNKRQQEREREREREEARKWRSHFERQTQERQSYSSFCQHDGWWPKIQGRTACPECGDVWTYLLQCPDCQMEACPKCQSMLRPRRGRNGARNFRKKSPGVRAYSPSYYHFVDYD